MLCVHPGELGRNRFPVGRVPVLFMRINVAKEDGYLCWILAVEVRRVKCVFPRNESAEGNGSISSKDREQSGG